MDVWAPLTLEDDEVVDDEPTTEEEPDPAGETSRTWPAWPGTVSLDATAGVGILLSRRISHRIVLSEEASEEAAEEAAE